MAGKAVFTVEYLEEGATAAAICPMANALDFDTLIKSYDLGALPRTACR
jgi:hypothetical protein